MRSTMLLLALTFLLSTASAIEIEDTSQTQSVNANVTIEGTGSITGNLFGQSARIEILSFQETQRQKILSLHESLEINGKQVLPEETLDKWGNRYALFKVNETGSFTYKIEATIQTNSYFPKLQDYDLSTEITQWQEFRNPTENIESNTESIRTFALNLLDSNSWLETAAKATGWSNNNIEYSLDYYPEIYSANTTLKTRKGVCDEYSVLTAAMLRAKGIPTRVVTGITFNPQEQQPWNNHAWLESFNPNSGWIALDPTFGQASLVDGTHIERGRFPDPENSSVVKATAVETASVTATEKPVQVEAQSYENFGNAFLLQGNDATIQANAWQTLKTEAKSNLAGTSIGWFSLVLPEGFEAQQKKEIMVFKEGETREIEWQVRINAELRANQQLKGSYRVTGFGAELQRNLTVKPGTSSPEAQIRLVELIPIVESQTLSIEASLENLGSESGTATISVDGEEHEIEIAGHETRTTTVQLSPAENRDYEISITGPGLDYRTVITVQEGIPFEKPRESPLSLPTATEIQGLAESALTVENILIVGIIAGIAAVGLLLKELLSR